MISRRHNQTSKTSSNTEGLNAGFVTFLDRRNFFDIERTANDPAPVVKKICLNQIYLVTE